MEVYSGIGCQRVVTYNPLSNFGDDDCSTPVDYCCLLQLRPFARLQFRQLNQLSRIRLRNRIRRWPRIVWLLTSSLPRISRASARIRIRVSAVPQIACPSINELAS